MERSKQIILTGLITFGLAGCVRESNPTPKWASPTLEKTGTSFPLPSESVIPTSSPTATVTETPLFTPYQTPEATQENLKGILPFKEFTVISSFLEKRMDHGEVTLHLGMDVWTEKEADRDLLNPYTGIFHYAGPTEGSPTDSLGNVVVIEYEWNGQPIYVIYAHLEKVVEGKKEGDEVSTGEILGKMGHSGTYSWNIHTHIEVWNKEGYEEIVAGINNERLERYGWPHVAGTYPHWDNKETVEKYLINPYTWLKNVSGQVFK